MSRAYSMLVLLAVGMPPVLLSAAEKTQQQESMLYAVDSKGESWKIFQTQTMPTNFLISKEGRIVSIASGCDPSGLIANALSKKVADLLETDAINVQESVKKLQFQISAPSVAFWFAKSRCAAAYLPFRLLARSASSFISESISTNSVSATASRQSARDSFPSRFSPPQAKLGCAQRRRAM